MKIPPIADIRRISKAMARHKYLLVIAVAGLILLSWPKGQSQAKKEIEHGTEGYAGFSIEETEEKMAQALSQIEGAGRVCVMLTLKSDMEIVFQQDLDKKTNSGHSGQEAVATQEESKRKTVLTNSSEPLVQKKLYPIYQGVLVICDGAENAAVQLAVKEAVSALTGLSGRAVNVNRMARGDLDKEGRRKLHPK
ncbi:MAG: hypothetical protein FWH04_02185 [Oscillospiraceae bacterium]|nr:hypothetical protein [Oscillospiraceae bacterium]